MKYHFLKYIITYTGPLSVFLAIYFGSYYSFLPVAYMFLLIPLLELLIPADPHNLDKTEEMFIAKSKAYDYLLYLNLPIQYALLVFYLYRITFTPLHTFEVVGMTIAMGLSCGILGINVAHELGHRFAKFEQSMSKALLLTALYTHFFIEHNRGHHKNVSTNEDPASAKAGEILYFFWVRSIITGYLSAWKLESERLKKTNHGVFSIHNEMLVFSLIQLVFLGIIAVVFSLKSMLLFMGAALIGILLLETVNYIEHYGLRRKFIKDAYYEKVMPHHSWNSDHVLGRLMLFELTRHSDHHYLAGRKYQLLRHFEGSPQMPTGYPGMMVVSLIPPLWFHIMNKQIQRQIVEKI